IQIALFVTPVLVLSSRVIAPERLTLSFTRVEVGALFLGVLIGVLVVGDGRANWVKGVQLVAFYLILAAMFYLIPAENHAQQGAPRVARPRAGACTGARGTARPPRARRPFPPPAGVPPPVLRRRARRRGNRLRA